MSDIENVRNNVQASIDEVQTVLVADNELKELQQSSLENGQTALKSTELAKSYIADFIASTTSALTESQWASKRIQNLKDGLDNTIVANTNLEGHKTNIDFIAGCFSAAAVERNAALKQAFQAADELRTVSGGLSRIISNNTELGEKVDAPEEGLAANIERANDHARVLHGTDNGSAEGFLKNIQNCKEDLTRVSDTAFNATSRINGPTPLADLTKRLEETVELLDSSTKKKWADFIICMQRAQANVTSDDLLALDTLHREIKESVRLTEGLTGHQFQLRYHAECAVEYGKVILAKSL